MPSHNTYRLTWVSLTLDMGYVFMAAPCLGQGLSFHAAPPDLDRGVAPLGPPAPVQPQLLGRGIAPLGRHPWPQGVGSSSRQLPLASGVG